MTVPFNPWTEPLLIPLVVLSAQGMSTKSSGSTVTLGGDLWQFLLNFLKLCPEPFFFFWLFDIFSV